MDNIMRCMKKIVIASDSFKGCLSSIEVADAAESGIRKTFPDCEVVKVAAADGGEGTAEVIGKAIGAERAEVPVSDPLGRPRSSFFYRKDNLAVIESAAACGLTLLSQEERNPLITSTGGLGEIILKASENGCRKFIIGLGGSATNDGGSGMLEAIGARFTGHDGQMIEGLCGEKISLVENIDISGIRQEILDSEFIIACDVDAPLTGANGATEVFAPQKGADPQMVKILEDGMKSYSGALSRITGRDIGSVPGSGAAGGLGAAFLSFFNARLEKGTDIILDTIDFDRLIADADLVITGEGKVDSQTEKGKLITGIIERAGAHEIPVLVIAGTVEEDHHLTRTGEKYPMVLPIGKRLESKSDLENAMRPEVASYAIENTVSKALVSLFPF